MKRLLIAWMAGAVLLSGTAPAAGAAPAKKSAVARDWARTVVVTPEGGFRMGNPAARVKLVEFGSLTCNACADFSRTGTGPLTALVKSGRVSFEFRNMVLNGVDLSASLVARCAGPSQFFPLIGKIFAGQEQWLARISGISDAQEQSLKALPRDKQLGRIAELAGLTRLAQTNGVAPEQAAKCLSDQGAVRRLADMHEAAARLGVEGTPSFLVNGALVHAHDWGELEPLIRKAGG